MRVATDSPKRTVSSRSTRGDTYAGPRRSSNPSGRTSLRIRRLIEKPSQNRTSVSESERNGLVPGRSRGLGADSDNLDYTNGIVNP